MDDTPQYLCFREYCLYGILKSRQAVHTEEHDIFHTPVMQVI